jgi:hypothetical protein
MATVFVNGIPSASSILLIAPATTAVLLTDPATLENGSFQFSFSSTPGAAFTALTTTNASLPLNDWTVLGAVTEVSPGRFQFTDSQAPGNSGRFYRVRN